MNIYIIKSQKVKSYNNSLATSKSRSKVIDRYHNVSQKSRYTAKKRKKKYLKYYVV